MPFSDLNKTYSSGTKSYARAYNYADYNKYVSNIKVLDPNVKAPANTLRFTPYAYQKLIFMRDIGNTEVAAFGISDDKDYLLIRDIRMVKQKAYSAFVEMTSEGVSEYVNSMIEEGIDNFNQFFRVWIHTHPMESPIPSGQDHETFNETFCNQTWSVMFILGNTGKTFASIQCRPDRSNNSVLFAPTPIPVYMDISDPNGLIGSSEEAWKEEYEKNVQAFDHAHNWADTSYKGTPYYVGRSGSYNYGSVGKPIYTPVTPKAATTLNDEYHKSSFPKETNLVNRVYGPSSATVNTNTTKTKDENKVERGVVFDYYDELDNDKEDAGATTLTRGQRRQEIATIANELGVTYDEVASVYANGDSPELVLDKLTAKIAIEDDFSSDLAAIRKDNSIPEDPLLNQPRRSRRKRGRRK